MSTAEPLKKSPAKSRNKEKRLAQRSSGGGGTTERLKTIVRRLPPNLPEDIFWQSVQKWATDDAVTWKIFYPGKLRKKANKENIHSRAYIAFRTEEQLAVFSREYDGHIFRDKAGNESQAIVEFAPYQKVPLEKKKVDNRNNTIDKDEDFIAFLQTLEESSAKPHDTERLMEQLIASTQSPAMPTSTPLLEALKAEKSAQKDKEAILRNHAHYKETNAASKKEEAKKKAAAAKHGEPPATLGKKAAKRAAKAAAAAQNAAAAQLQANTPQPKASTSNAPATPAKAAAIPTGPKGGRGSRHPSLQIQEPQLLKRPSTPGTSAGDATQPSPVTAKLATAATVAQKEGGGGRRARPVLGIGSRQFEAALSGAGVAKPKRERRGDKDAEKGKEREGPAGEEGKEAGKGKDREARRKEEKGPAEGRAARAAAPAILQREAQPSAPRILTKPADGDDGPVHAVSPVAQEGGGRGRGRGRGRGKPANRGG